MANTRVKDSAEKRREVDSKTHWRTHAVCTVIAVAIVISGFVIPGQAQAQEPPVLPLNTNPKHAALMEKKLASVQKIVEGIAREDFVKIRREAQLLRLMSMEAGWNVIQTPEYVRMSEHFRGTTDQLKRATKRRDIEAVGLAYVSLSISCINCHRHARSELMRIGQSNSEPSSIQFVKGIGK